jgi:dTDP-4-amino-4,6-dideoxygalactose transaminase
MNEIQAAVGCVQVDKADLLTDKRREIGHAITEGLQGIKGIYPVYEPEEYKHVFHLYTLRIDEKELGASRDEFMRVLYKEEGIQTILHYQPSYHFTGVKKAFDYPEKICPEAEKFFYAGGTNLPMHPRLTKQNIKDMVEGIRNAAEKVRGKGK